MRIECDCLVVGGGVAGLVATLRLARAGARVICLDDRPTPSAAVSEDLRTTALLSPSIALLEELGAWERLAPRATPLSVLRIIDAAGERPSEARFDAREIEQEAFGQNMPNDVLLAELRAAVERREGAEHWRPARLAHALARDDWALAVLEDGRQLRARLLIGADGRRSTVRETSGIAARRIDYGQRAMVFAVSHDTPHGNASTEIYREAGPFTLTPCEPDAEGRARSGVVWVERSVRIEELAAMSDETLAAAATERSLGRFGPLKVISGRMTWPSASLLAERFTARRTALIAEAAHACPPIGAQGLNMSFEDVRVLSDLVAEAIGDGRDPGGEATLKRYAAIRWPDVAARLVGTAALNAISIGAIAPIRDARRLGVQAMRDVGALRRGVMRMGLGA